jgi:hypothetical protein
MPAGMAGLGSALRPHHGRSAARSAPPSSRHREQPRPGAPDHLHHSSSAQRTSLPRRFLALANCARPGGGRRERPPTDCTCEPYEVRGLQVGGLAGWPRVTANERSRRATPTRSKDARRRRRAARRGPRPLGAGRRSGTSTFAATGSRCKRALSRCCYRLSLSRKCAKSDCGSNGGTSTPDFANVYLGRSRLGGLFGPLWPLLSHD